METRTVEDYLSYRAIKTLPSSKVVSSSKSSTMHLVNSHVEGLNI